MIMGVIWVSSGYGATPTNDTHVTPRGVISDTRSDLQNDT